MQIRRQLGIGCVLGTLAVAGAIVHLADAQRETLRVLELNESSTTVTLTVTGLLAATNDLDSRNRGRAVRQWESNHQTMGQTLVRIQRQSSQHVPGVAEIAADLLDRHGAMGELFRTVMISRFDLDSEEHQLQLEVITGRLTTEAQLLAEEGLRLERLLDEQTARIQSNAQWSAVAALSLMGIVIAAGSGLIVYRILTPLRTLDVAARHAAGSDYKGAIIEQPGDNEFGHAAKAFNQMVETVRRREEQLHNSNAQLAAATRQLEESLTTLEQRNEELHEFARVASHDLKAPLNAIAQLAQWVQEDSKELLSEESLQHLELLTSRASRLRKLLEDLLNYSRTGRERVEREAVDVVDSVQRILRLMHNEEVDFIAPASAATVVVPRVPFETVMHNLISNAIKHHDNPPARVELILEASPDFYFFGIKDDGPGIPPEYHEKVFGAFQTLKPRDELEASGMGLAFVKKLVHIYGGEVWFEPGGNRGTTVRFKWPKPSSDKPDDGREMEMFKS